VFGIRDYCNRLSKSEIRNKFEPREMGKLILKNLLCGSTRLWVAFVISFCVCASGQDWPQWGGTPARNMYCPAKNLPDHFTKDKAAQIKFKAGTEEVDRANLENLKWVAKIGSQSYGNVTVSHGRVFLGTNNEPPRDPRHPGDRSILLCLDEKSGEMLWQMVIPKLASGKVNDWESLGLLSSPTIEGDHAYIVSSRCELLCLDVNGMANGNDGPFKDEAKYVVKDVILDKGKPTERPAPPIEPGPKDGDLIWRYDMIDELGVFPHNASDGSPLIVGDIVYVNTSNGQDWTHSNIPAPNAPSLIAVNKITGQLVGEDDAKIGPRIFHGLWSSPSTGNVNGRQLVFYGGGDGICYAFDPKPVKEGDANYLKKVWWCDLNPPERKKFKYPDAEGPSEVNATPVFWKNRIYTAVGQDPEHGEGVGILTCIDATKTGDITQTGKIWSYDKIHRSLSTVSITPEGLLFVGDFSGYLHCFDAETGKLYWTHDLKAHIWGSTLVADGKVYVGDEDGDLAVFEASKEKKLLSVTNLGAPVYSTPVVANGVLYISSNTHLFAFAKLGPDLRP
jgi:outer membrane protein assembly factor BamB